jgi:hypothetical protein
MMNAFRRINNRRRRRQHIDIAVNVVGPAVQKNYRRTIGGAGFGVPDIEEAGIDLLEGPKPAC